MEIGNQMLQVVLNGHSLKFLLKLWRGGGGERDGDKKMGIRSFIIGLCHPFFSIMISRTWMLV